VPRADGKPHVSTETKRGSFSSSTTPPRQLEKRRRVREWPKKFQIACAHPIVMPTSQNPRRVGVCREFKGPRSRDFVRALGD